MPDEKSVEVKATHGLERAVQIVKNMTNIELSRYQPFMDEYVAAMFLPHTDRSLFPSCARQFR